MIDAHKSEMLKLVTIDALVSLLMSWDMGMVDQATNMVELNSGEKIRIKVSIKHPKEKVK